MIQTVLSIIKMACERGVRAVILVPEGAYEESLRALSCRFDRHSGRTAQMPNGNLVTILTAATSVGEITGDFDLYLSGWGKATPKDERGMLAWVNRASVVYTEVN